MPPKDPERLRCGFTTGTAAAAATKAALLSLLDGRKPGEVEIELLNGKRLPIRIHGCGRAGGAEAHCSVIKDGGDDPDITHGAEIGARVIWQAGVADRRVVIRGGRGVGRVTKPGLEIAPGRPAITSGPRTMIRQAAMEVMEEHGLRGQVDIEIFVPDGETLARRTLNARLGIVGGISILGTTGEVHPLSHEAYIATIEAALSVARAAGLRQVVLATGRRSERFAQKRWPSIAEEGFIQIGDFFARAMEIAAARRFKRVILAVFFGKALKMAQGVPHTHARSARLTLEVLAQWARQICRSTELAEQVAAANTARHAFDLIETACPALIEKVGREIVSTAKTFGGRKVDVKAAIFGFDGRIRFESAGADQ